MNPADDELPQRLTADRVRAARFSNTRHGYDPAAVDEYLGLVADEILRLHEQLATAYADTDRLKRYLRQWQSDHVATCRGSLLGTTSHDWPINSS